MNAPELPTEAGLRLWQERLGLADLDSELVRQAFVHRSYAYEHGEVPDNERLEFLGDAVVGLVICEHLYARYPAWREGELTRRKSSLVSRHTLASIAARLDLGPLLALGRGEEATGGRERASVLGNALEALIGCLYLQQGYAAVKRFILRIWEPELQALQSPQADAKSALQERIQAALRRRPEYVVLSEQGPDHAKRFTVRATLDGRVLGEGTGATKKEAEQRAAREALKRAFPGEPEWYTMEEK